MSEALEALGACFVVLGLAFWSLPTSLIVAGLFLVIVANAPGGAPVDHQPSGRGDRRAETRP